MDKINATVGLLAEDLKEEVEYNCGIPIGSTTILQPNWIPGTELTIGVPREFWHRVCGRIPERVAFSDMIQLYWFKLTQSERWYYHGHVRVLSELLIENELYIRLGRAVWQSTRGDRGQGSRMTNMLNNDPIGSTNRLQTLRLVRGSGTGVLPYEGNDVQGQHRLLHLIAQFLEMTLRLSPKDIGNFIGRVARKISGPFDARRPILVGSCEEEYLMLQAARRAIVHAQDHRYWPELYKIRLPPSLKQLDDLYHISAADRSFRGCWAVLVILCSHQARQAICQRQPSLFISAPRPLQVKPQVHIIDSPICGFSLPLLLGFNENPKNHMIDGAMDLVREALELPHHASTRTIGSSSAIVTEPFAKEEGIAWFRADGVLEMNFKDLVLSRQVRKAMAKLRSTHFEWKKIRDSGLFVDDRESVRWVLWLRQSNEDGPRARDTMPRQLTTLMRSTVLGRGWRDGDEVVICCEYCSSSKHPLTDRRLWNTIRGMGGMPVNLLTVNPDRMTRREEEVDIIRTYVASTGGFWHTQGVIKEGCEIDDWYKVDGDIVALIKAQLVLGRKRALQAGFYARQTQVMTTINNAVDRMEPQVPTQINAAAAVIRHCVEAHGYQRICTIAHTGEAYDTGKTTDINKSIVRQSQFLSIMVGACQVPIVPLQLSGVSNESLLGCLKRLPNNANIDGLWVKNVKTLFVFCSVSRSAASTAELETLVETVGDGGVMALLWDCYTNPDACEALRLDERHRNDPAVAAWDRILVGQKRVPSHSLNLPILQPILWIAGSDKSHPNTTHAMRQVQNAQDFRKGSLTSAYQGGPEIAPELSERGLDKHGLSDEREKV